MLRKKLSRKVVVKRKMDGIYQKPGTNLQAELQKWWAELARSEDGACRWWECELVTTVVRWQWSVMDTPPLLSICTAFCWRWWSLELNINQDNLTDARTLRCRIDSKCASGWKNAGDWLKAIFTCPISFYCCKVSLENFIAYLLYMFDNPVQKI